VDNPTVVPPAPYPDPMNGEHLSVQQLAEQLGCAPDVALHLVRTVGPKGVIRTADRRFVIPATAVEQLRAALAAGDASSSPPPA
jgi:hypothetical protein